MKKKIKKQTEGDYKELLQRTLADFENYKKRTEAEKAQWTDQAKADLLGQLLPLFDNLALIAQHKPEVLKDNSWAKGIELVVSQIESILQNEGIEKIDAKSGDVFDHQIHEAVSAIENKDIDSGKIVKMQKPGYRIGTKVIRPAQVITAK